MSKSDQVAVSESATLAERCFASASVQDELFDRVNKLLGCDVGRCAEDGFVWGATDIWWDEYDGSIEVVRPRDSSWMAQEQANAILDLGFALIYETIGDQARTWCRYGHRECRPIGGDQYCCLRATIAALRKQLSGKEFGDVGD